MCLAREMATDCDSVDADEEDVHAVESRPAEIRSGVPLGIACADVWSNGTGAGAAAGRVLVLAIGTAAALMAAVVEEDAGTGGMEG